MAEGRYLISLSDALDPMSDGMKDIGQLLGQAGADPNLLFADWWAHEMALARTAVLTASMQLFQLSSPSSMSHIHHKALLIADEASLAMQWLDDGINLLDLQKMYQAEEAMAFAGDYGLELADLLENFCD